MTPTHYHINTLERVTIKKMYSDKVCTAILETPRILKTNITQTINTIVCSLDNLKLIQ